MWRKGVFRTRCRHARPHIWHAELVLRLGGARLLNDRDLPAVRTILDADPVVSCMVTARVEMALGEIARVAAWSLRGLGMKFGVADRAAPIVAWTEAVEAMASAARAVNFKMLRVS